MLDESNIQYPDYILLVVDEEIIVVQGTFVASDAACVHAFRHTAGKQHTFRVFIDGFVGLVLHVEPVVIVRVVACLALNHNSNSTQEFLRPRNQRE